jgi:predicted TPR repeat methyltransferase
MPDAHYLNPKLADIYDFDSPWSLDRDFYLSLAEAPHQDILDLGCGTGLLCDAYATKGHQVTGVDPSPAMLKVAARKPNGARIEWIRSSSQEYRSDKQFDLIVMTGHAFQVLLHDNEIDSTFQVIREHLKPHGIAVFESRNPAIDWANAWNYDMQFESPHGAVRESRRFTAMKNDRMTFELCYEFPDEKLISLSELRFLSRMEIEEHLSNQGLQVRALFGNWDCSPFLENTSHEMIFCVRVA